jgi:TolB protein
VRRRNDGKTEGRKETAAARIALVALALSVFPSFRLSAQDTGAVDRGVRVGIVYRPGVRPGIVMLPGPVKGLDSVRTIVLRDLDYSDRFEIITLPGGEQATLAGTLGGAAPPRGQRTGGSTAGGRAGRAGGSEGSQPAGLNYPLYRALGADFAVDVGAAGDTTVVVLHDVMAAAVRRTFRTRVPPPSDDGFRMAVHRLSDQIVQAALGAPGIAATRLLFVMDGKAYRIDQDGADMELVSSSNRQAMSPAWAPDGRRFAYMEFQAGHGQLFVHDLGTGKRTPVSQTGRTLDFTPAFSPDGKALAFSRAGEEGTDIYTLNIKDNCCLQRLTVGRFSDNLSPAYSPDGQRIAFVSTRPGLPQIYVMAADGTDQQLFAPFDYGITGSSNAPEWSPDGQSVAFHRDVARTLQVFVLDVRTRIVRQLTSVGRNEDPSWAPDSRHMAYVSDRAGYRQLWIIDLETGRIRPLLQRSGARLPAWSPRLPEIGSSNR